ncbi:MAG: M3 family metallopeptidase [Terricaulis sp.]
MKKHLIAVCLLALMPLATSCQTSSTGSAGAASQNAASPYQAAQAEVARLTALSNENVLTKPWTGEYGGVPPFDHADPALLPAALQLAIDLQKAEIDVIATNPAPATFQNTMAALEDAGRALDRVSTIYSVMTSNTSNAAVQAIDAEWSPKLTAAYNAITFNHGLYQRIDDLYQRRANLGLTAEQLRLLERSHDQFVRAGAAASPEQQARLGQINQTLSSKFAEFNRRLLADEDTATFITNRGDLAGLPQNIVDQLAQAAADRQHRGQWAVVNTRSSVDPFLTFSANRPLRQQIWTKFKNRGDNGDANDTNAIIHDIVLLRAERAHILGFATHANYRMADTMAHDPAKAMDLMMRVWRPAVQRVHEEVRDMQAIANREHAHITIEPWDYLYYAEKVRKARYDLDQNQLRPYFELNNMISASFYMAEQLYGLHFTEITGTVPVFNPDVRVWRVNDRDGSYVGLFYGDYFARAGKRSGAWTSGYRGHETFSGTTFTPITSNNNNFVHGAPGQPILISLDDAQTLFHEFGHAIHGLVSRVDYPGLGGTPRDYVEYPSQVHEHWVLTRPILDRFALHYQTHQPMPQALVDKVHRSETFNQGYDTVEYLSAAIVDMKLHLVPDGNVDPDAFERQTLAEIGMPHEIAMRHRLPQFSHLFASDAYSAGYYSYLWSNVMEADTWEMFEQSGNVFNPTIAAGMRNIILAPGNTTDRAEAYRQFRGRDPDVNALLRVRGFPVENAPASSGH